MFPLIIDMYRQHAIFKKYREPELRSEFMNSENWLNYVCKVELLLYHVYTFHSLLEKYFNYPYIVQKLLAFH